jgi:hypothetical protein
MAEFTLGVGTISKDHKAFGVECESHTLTWITTLKGGGLWLTGVNVDFVFSIKHEHVIVIGDLKHA